jgi:glycosyltransferase involved in cell wall biosynthesis
MIFKIKKFGMSPEQVKQSFDKILAEEKAKLRMYPRLDDYIRDIVIAEDITDEQIYALHQYCDCFVCPSHGEAWSIPSFDAMAFGKTPICSAFGGPMEFVDMNNSNTGELLAGVFAPCQCSDAAFPDMFTGRESWYIPCEDDLKSAMRQYYNRRDDNNKAKIDGLTKAKEFSYETIGNLMKGILSE